MSKLNITLVSNKILLRQQINIFLRLDVEDIISLYEGKEEKKCRYISDEGPFDDANLQSIYIA